MSALIVDRVEKRFAGLRAVADASFEVGKRSIVGLIGPNGAGKTTLFNLIAGVHLPDAGEVRFDGTRISGLRPDQICKAGIGRTFQLVRPFAGLSVCENVIIGALQRERSVHDARVRARAVLDRLGLGHKANDAASSLTLPERKRLEVARALATQPRLLLLDEVMAGLRPTETEEMVRLFRELNRESQIAILLIEHVMSAVMALAHDVVVLSQGGVIARGAPDSVVRDPEVVRCYLGEEPLSPC
jgi:branched-chain amino acid transport system ATP-binding protein